MTGEFDFDRVQEFLVTDETDARERGEVENLVDQAKKGDEVALHRLRQLTFERGYQPIPGQDTSVPPGRLMVCPVNPTHYRTYQREVGEICIEHEVELVPADALESSE